MYHIHMQDMYIYIILNELEDLHIYIFIRYTYIHMHIQILPPLMQKESTYRPINIIRRAYPYAWFTFGEWEIIITYLNVAPLNVLYIENELICIKEITVIIQWGKLKHNTIICRWYKFMYLFPLNSQTLDNFPSALCPCSC